MDSLKSDGTFKWKIERNLCLVKEMTKIFIYFIEIFKVKSSDLMKQTIPSKFCVYCVHIFITKDWKNLPQTDEDFRWLFRCFVSLMFWRVLIIWLTFLFFSKSLIWNNLNTQYCPIVTSQWKLITLYTLNVGGRAKK